MADHDDSGPGSTASEYPTVDPDIQCAVGVVSRPGKRCECRLDCRYRSEEQKHAVSDRSRPYDELLNALPLATANVQSKKGTQLVPPVVVDLDLHCGVVNSDGNRYGRSIACAHHSEEQKRAVIGRSTNYDATLQLYRNNHQQARSTTAVNTRATDRDIQCAVAMADGQLCKRALNCHVHSKSEREAVTGRSISFNVLLRVQATQTASATRSLKGYGLVVAPARESEHIGRLRRIYRRNGMQAAMLDDDVDGETRESAYTMLSPAGDNLVRVRQLIDSRWRNVSDESAELLSIVLEATVSAADKSEYHDPRQTNAMTKQQEDDNKDGIRLIGLRADADRYWTAFTNEGHDTAIVPLMFSQTMAEAPCADAPCTIISRGFEQAHILYLDFPSERNEDEEFDLGMLLSKWAADDIYDGEGHRCERVSTHTKGLMWYRCFVRLARYIIFAIRRGGVGHVHVFNKVDVPEELDLQPYAQLESMPSSMQEAAGVGDIAAVAEPETTLYDLAAVVTWKGGHYIAYVRDWTATEESGWVMFNDLDEYARKKTPFTGLTEGEIIHYATYRRQGQGPAGPAIGARTNQPPGARDADPMQGFEQGGPRTGTTSAASGTTSERQPRPRPDSSDAEFAGKRPSLPRGDLHGDVASARAASEVSARETQVQLDQNRLLREQNKLQHDLEDLQGREAALNQQMEHLNMRTSRLEELEALEAKVTAMAKGRDGYREAIEKQRNGLVERNRTNGNEIAGLDQQIQDLSDELAEDTVVQARDGIVQMVEEDREETQIRITRLQEKLMQLMDLE